MLSTDTLLYGSHLVPYGYEDAEYLLDQSSLVGYRDCHAINASIVCNAPAGSSPTKRLVMLLEAWNSSDGMANPLVRIEFLHNLGSPDRLGLRGAVVFDSGGNPVFHFVNALLGYYGSGFYFSRDILRALSMPDDDITLLNESVVDRYSKKQPFVAVVEKRQFDVNWKQKVFD